MVVQTGSVPHSSSYPVVPGFFTSCVKCIGHETNPLLLFVVEVKNAWSYAFMMLPMVRLYSIDDRMID
jgi:hypothetical protein